MAAKGTAEGTGEGSLTRYHRRRDFSRTAEPRGKPRHGTEGDQRGEAVERAGEGPGDGNRAASFVVQIHDASTLHFDFRLEADGVLKSFAVPKGPSDNPREKRFATPTEDHPLEYRTFEGTIAAGGYGAGTVIVWDEGTYLNTTTDRHGKDVPLAEALDRGHASFRLNGRKLHGGYALTRIRTAAQEGREAWLLVKEADGRAGAAGTPDPRRARSARTGRTLGQVAAEETAKGDAGGNARGNAEGGRR
ncbi:DNA polymerase ligase N-terminal domain-containing protein [Streptomyces sp. NPDC008150]|uniref:DNA polymerase ligase N-terminal domain-containing protein n=1 Tax=Streptomyces sp. NPDC008150 TaxID=3364816 RepID=UPI0036EFA86D